MLAPRHVSYVGEVQVLRIGEQHTDASIYRVEHLAPDRTRRWYVAPQSLYGDSMISDGRQTFSIDAKNDRVVVSNDDDLDDQVAEDDNFGVMMANYNAVYGPSETLDGRAVRVVLLNNRYTGATTIRLRIDAKTGLVLERQQYGGNGSLIEQTRFEQIRYTNAIPVGLFTVPANLRRVRADAHTPGSEDVSKVVAQAGFTTASPKYLPEGFTPVSADVSMVHGVKTLHILFSDGIRTVSLFQNDKGATADLSRFHPVPVKIGDREGRAVEQGPTTLLAWSDGARHFALVGDLSRNEMQKIASSVLP